MTVKIWGTILDVCKNNQSKLPSFFFFMAASFKIYSVVFESRTPSKIFNLTMSILSVVPDLKVNSFKILTFFLGINSNFFPFLLIIIFYVLINHFPISSHKVRSLTWYVTKLYLHYFRTIHIWEQFLHQMISNFFNIPPTPYFRKISFLLVRNWCYVSSNYFDFLIL